MVKATEGILVKTDEPTVVFIQHLNEHIGPRKFIISVLDSRHLLIKRDPDIVKYIKKKLAERLMETTYDEDELADQPVLGGATA